MRHKDPSRLYVERESGTIKESPNSHLALASRVDPVKRALLNETVSISSYNEIDVVMCGLAILSVSYLFTKFILTSSPCPGLRKRFR